MSLGAATLADIFDPAERGTVMGIYYIAPLLGPSLGSIIGGALAQAWNWRATFWFLAIWSGCCVISFVFFKDTFRKERSLTYQAVVKRIKAEQAASPPTVSEKDLKSDDGSKSAESERSGPNDVEAQAPVLPPLKDVKLSLTDLNPVTPIFHILRRWNNFFILVPSGEYFSQHCSTSTHIISGLLFAFTYCICYTCSLTMSSKYGSDALKIGLVLLAFGIGEGDLGSRCE